MFDKELHTLNEKEMFNLINKESLTESQPPNRYSDNLGHHCSL